MAIVFGLIILPFLLWSWWRHGHDEDASGALSVLGGGVLAALAAGLGYWVFG